MKYACDLCGATEQLPLPGDPSGKIGICKSCGFIYVSERRSIEEVAKAWTDIYADGGYDPSWPGVKARLFYVAEWLDQHVGLKDKSILDIGAGNGEFLLRCLHRMAGQLTGLDPDPDNCRKIRDYGFDCIEGYAAKDWELPDERYDIITLNWTLENTGDCMSVLEYAKSCLKPDGIIAVATGSRLFVPYKKPLSEYLPQDKNYPHDTHCFRWEYNTLNLAAELCDLESAVEDWQSPPDKDGDSKYLESHNDYINRDEMICLFHHSIIEDKERDEKKLMILDYCHKNEDAEDLFEYFLNWKRQFP